MEAGRLSAMPAGCGLTVRVMDAEADVLRNGQAGIVRVSAAKKLEGAPEHVLNRAACVRAVRPASRLPTIRTGLRSR